MGMGDTLLRSGHLNISVYLRPLRKGRKLKAARICVFGHCRVYAISEVEDKSARVVPVVHTNSVGSSSGWLDMDRLAEGSLKEYTRPLVVLGVLNEDQEGTLLACARKRAANKEAFEDLASITRLMAKYGQTLPARMEGTFCPAGRKRG